MIAPDPDCVAILQHRCHFDDTFLWEEDITGVSERNEEINATRLQSSECPREQGGIVMNVGYQSDSHPLSNSRNSPRQDRMKRSADHRDPRSQS
jgi:hypothetical protein